MPAPPPRATAPATRPREARQDAEPIDAQLDHRVGRDRGGRARPGAHDPVAHHQALPDPQRLDGADAGRRPARAGQPHRHGLQRTPRRRDRGLSPAGRTPSRRSAARHRTWSSSAGQPARSRSPNRTRATNFIKRIVAGPGDEIYIREGHVYRKPPARPNSSARATPTSAPAAPSQECNFPTPIKIPPGHWFMMGDNRGESDDSRFWGPVPTGWIIGGAVATYWPPDRIGFL